jgi:hypothetical protein
LDGWWRLITTREVRRVALDLDEFGHPARVLVQFVLRPLAHGPELVTSVVE